MKKNILIGLGTAAVAVTVGTIQVSGQSVTFNFADNTSDGWVAGGFSSSPALSLVSIAGQNYISVGLTGGYQVANVNSGSLSGNAPLQASFNAAMDAAFHNPSAYQLTYNYYIDTSAPSSAGTYLQMGTYVNSGTGSYGQTGTPSAYDPQWDGTQLASGNVFFGSVTVPFTAFGTDPNADTYYRLGFILNGNGTTTAGPGAPVTVDITDISISSVPEPVTLALGGVGLLGGLLALRRRLS